jgi:hypothetical protein
MNLYIVVVIVEHGMSLTLSSYAALGLVAVAEFGTARKDGTAPSL